MSNKPEASNQQPVCQHQQLFVDSKVLQLSDTANGPVTSIALEVKIHCVNCGKEFVFSRSATFYEVDTIVRIPIKPVRALAHSSQSVVTSPKSVVN